MASMARTVSASGCVSLVARHAAYHACTLPRFCASASGISRGMRRVASLWIARSTSNATSSSTRVPFARLACEPPVANATKSSQGSIDSSSARRTRAPVLTQWRDTHTSCMRRRSSYWISVYSPVTTRHRHTIISTISRVDSTDACSMRESDSCAADSVLGRGRRPSSGACSDERRGMTTTPHLCDVPMRRRRARRATAGAVEGRGPRRKVRECVVYAL